MNKFNPEQPEATLKETTHSNAIKLSLLHPSKLIPVETWSFENKPIIKIGRSSNNHVRLDSAMVSRYHLGICPQESSWEIINFGANGTYWNSQLITQAPVVEGMIIYLGRSGPRIQIHLISSDPEQLQKTLSSHQRLTERTANNLYSTFIPPNKQIP